MLREEVPWLVVQEFLEVLVRLLPLPGQQVTILLFAKLIVGAKSGGTIVGSNSVMVSITVLLCFVVGYIA
jgi:hypothetical protein